MRLVIVGALLLAGCCTDAKLFDWHKSRLDAEKKSTCLTNGGTIGHKGDPEAWTCIPPEPQRMRRSRTPATPQD